MCISLKSIVYKPFILKIWSFSQQSQSFVEIHFFVLSDIISWITNANYESELEAKSRAVHMIQMQDTCAVRCKQIWESFANITEVDRLGVLQ